MKKKYFPWSLFVRENLLMLIIISVATWLRVWQIDSHGILFSTAGRDLIIAHDLVHNEPLTLFDDIQSKAFERGSITLWLQIAIISLFGVNTLALSLIFSLLSVAAVIGLYEFVCIYISKKHAITASLFLAASPLAVAHARVPYYISLLPLVLVLYLFSLLLFWHGKKYSFLLVGVACAILFQFKVTITALFLLVPFIIWRQKLTINRENLLQFLVGVCLILLPQIIFDLTHSLIVSQLLVTLVSQKLYALAEIANVSSASLSSMLSSFATFVGRIFSTDYNVISVFIVLMVCMGFFYAAKIFKNQTIPPALLLSELALILVIGELIITGSLSEAQFVPLLILLPIHLAFTIFSLPIQAKYLTILCVIFIGIFNTFSITQHNFFVDNPQRFSYGTSTGEIRRIFAFAQSKNFSNFTFATLNDRQNPHPDRFEHFRWIALENNYTLPLDSGKTFYIEDKNNAPKTTPYMSREFQTVKVYWNP